MRVAKYLLLTYIAVMVGLCYVQLCDIKTAVYDGNTAIMALSIEIERKDAVSESENPTWTSLGTFEVTHYCDGELTATGTKVHEGVVAVDPTVIPLGSEIYIDGYGTFTAEDTGKDIVGKRLDVFIPDRSECLSRGRVEREVFIP